jgi:hypothetical protein
MATMILGSYLSSRLMRHSEVIIGLRIAFVSTKQSNMAQSALNLTKGPLRLGMGLPLRQRTVSLLRSLLRAFGIPITKAYKACLQQASRRLHRSARL